jgi:hypothetical protein
MNEPRTPEEFFCILRKLIASGAFDTVGPRSEIEQALLEIARALFRAAANGTTPSACERLVGSLFVRSIEQSVTPDHLVTLSDADPTGS